MVNGGEINYFDMNMNWSCDYIIVFPFNLGGYENVSQNLAIYMALMDG